MPETLQDLYGKLEKANIKLPDYNTFEKKYNVEGGADVLYSKLSSANVKLPDVNTFKSKYFSSAPIQKDVLVPAGRDENGYPLVTVNETKSISLPEDQYKQLQSKYSVLDSMFKTLKPTIDNISSPINTKDVYYDNTQKPQGSLKDVLGIEIPQIKRTTENAYKSLIKTNIEAAGLNASSDDDYADLYKVKSAIRKTQADLDVIKNGTVDDVSTLIYNRKKELELQLAKETEFNINKPISTEGSLLGDYITNKVNVNSEYNTVSYDLDKIAQEANFEKAPILSNNIEESLKLPQDKLLSVAEQVGNNILNAGNNSNRVNFQATAQLDEVHGGYSKAQKDNFAYTGIQAEISNTYKLLEIDSQEFKKGLDKVVELQKQLRLDPTNTGLIEEIQIKIAELKPLELSIDNKKQFIGKLNEATFGLKEIQKQIDRQKEADKNWETYYNSSLLSTEGVEGVKYVGKGLLNSLSNTLKSSALIGNQLAKSLGTKSEAETERIKSNLLADESAQFKMPVKYSMDEMFTKDNSALGFDINWHIALPMTADQTVRTLMMGGVASRFPTNLVGKVAGLYSGSALVYGGDILKGELQKGLNFNDALAVTNGRLLIEAVTELANPLEFIPFNGAAKGLKGYSKSDFIDFVGNNWKSMLPKLKAKGVNLVTFLTEMGKQAGMESFEEIMSDLGNYGLDKYALENIKSDYSQENQFNVDNEINTFFSTALTMAPMAGYGAYVEGKESKQFQNVRWQASQMPSTFLDNLKTNLKKGYITPEFYETGKKEVETISSLYDVNKIKIDNVEESERPAYLNSIYELDKLQKQLLSETDPVKSEELAKQIEKASLKVNKYDKEAISNANLTPQQKTEKVENRYIENLKQFSSKEDLEKASVEDLNTGILVLQQVVENPFSPKVGQEAQKQIDLINEQIIEKSKLTKVEEVVITPIEQAKQQINTLSKEELENYKIPKELSKEEKKEVYNLKLQRQQELEDTENTFSLDNKTFKKGEKVSIDDNKTNKYYTIQGEQDGKILLKAEFEGVTETTKVSSEDIVTYIPKIKKPIASTETSLEIETNPDDIFGKPQEISIDGIEAKKADIEIVGNIANLKNKNQVLQSPSGKYGILSAEDNTTIIWSDTLEQAIEKININNNKEQPTEVEEIAETVISTEDLISLAASKYNTTTDTIIRNKRLQSVLKRLTGEKYISKLNEEQRKKLEKYLLSLKSKKEQKEEKLQETEEQRAKNKELVKNAALQFKIGNTTAIWNTNTQSFEFYNPKFDKKEANLNSVALSFSQKPNILNTWWDSLLSNKAKDEIVEAKNTLFDLLYKTNGIVDVEPQETPEIFLLKTLRGAIFSLSDKNDLTDVSDRWFKEGERTISDLANDLINDPIASEGILSNLDEQEIEQAIKDIISEYPNGVTKKDIERAIFENDTNSNDVLELEEEIALKFGVDIQTVIIKLGDQINQYEEERRIEKETQEENLSKGTSNDREDVQQTEVVTPQEVSGVKPKTAEKAEKEQEKEVVEKFTEPANPFKNGKVKTSNWNTVLSKITDLTLPNYRVRVVNTNSLTLEQLPFQTKKYFEDQARIQKTTVEDVISKDKGKLLFLTDKEGNYILEDGLPVVTNFPDGKLAEYKVQYERQGLTEQQYFEKIEQIKEARKNNSTLLIDRISNYPIEVTEDTNELSVVIGENEFSITRGGKGFPVAKIGDQEVSLISRKLNSTEIDSILYILFKRWATSGSMADKKSDKYQKAQYVQRLILTGTGIGKINFKGDPKLRTWEITLKQPDNSWKTATEQEVRDFLQNQWINVDINLSKENTPFTTYKMEEGKTVIDKVYPTYKDFLKENIKTKGVSATKLQDNFYIEVGATDNTLSAKLEEAKDETPVIPPVVTTTPSPNPEIVTNSPALDEFKDILNEKEKPIDPLIIDDDFTGLLRSRKLSQEATTEQNKKAKEWFANSPLSKFISLNQLQNIVNSDAFASWNWGAINLFKGSQYTDLYHEAWHEFSQLYLTKKQKESLYGEIKKTSQYKNATNKEIEEIIAEDFRNYALSNGTLILNNKYQRNSIFRKIWNFIKEWVTGNTDIQTVYERLYTGNISKYRRDLNNAFWGNLNLGVTLSDGKQLSDTDTKNLYRAIDSLVGTIFQQNGKPVTMMFGDNKVLSTVYGAIYKNLVNKRNVILKSIQDKAKQTNLSPQELQKLRIEQQTFYNLKDVTDNWNKIIQEHRQYSAFFNISKDRIKLDEEGNIISIDDKFTEETDEGNDRNSELIKNENVSSKEMASNETIFTIATLPRYNSDGTKAVNPFFPFVQDIVDFNSTWDKLTTATNNTLNYDQIVGKIEELGKSNKSFQDLVKRIPNPNKVLSDDEQRMKGAFMNDISKPLVQVYELIMSPIDGKMISSYKTAASSDIDKVKKQWNDNFESSSPFIKQHPDDSLYTDKEEIISLYSATGTSPAFYYNKDDYNKADKKQMFENRIDFLSKIGINFTEELLSQPEFQEFITKDFVKTTYTKHSPVFALYDLLTKAKEDISSLSQLSKVNPSSTYFDKYNTTISKLAEFELLGSNNLFAQSVKNAEQNNVWQIRQWNYITKIFNALNDTQKYPTYQDLIKEDWLKQFDLEANPYVKGIYLNTLFDLNPESSTYGQRRVVKKGNKTIYPTISLQDYNGMRLNLADNKTNEGKGTTSLTAFEKIVQNINSLLLFNTQENLRYGDKSSSFSTSISHYYNPKTGKLEERKSIIPFDKFINGRIANILPEEAYKYLVADLKQEIIPMIKFTNDNVGVNFKHYNKNIKNFGTFEGILSKETKEIIQEQIIKANVQDEKEINRILLSLPLKEEFETYIQTKSEQLSTLLDTQGLLEDKDIFDPRLISENTKDENGKTIQKELPKQSLFYGYIVNSLLYNIEHTKIISFDPRFYKSPKDVIKRLSAYSATGNMFVVDDQTNNFIESKGNVIKDAVAKKLGIVINKIAQDGGIRSVIFTENKYSADKLFAIYKEKFIATGKYTAEQLQTILKAYTAIEEADGQGYVTLDLLRQSKYRAGSSHWTKEHEIAYQKEAKFISGESTEGMSLEEMPLFTVQKWQYAGIGLENNIPYPTFYKFSVVPLIPSAIKGTNFEQIHDNLVKQNVGLGLFESGSKASSNQGVELNKDGSIKLDNKGNPITKSNPFYSNYTKRDPYTGEYVINNIFFQYLKEQVNVDPSLKEEVTFSTQMRKLLHLNQYNNGVPNDVTLSPKQWNKLSNSQKSKTSEIYRNEQRFGEVIEKLVEIEQEKLLKKMGAVKQQDGNYKLDAEKLTAFFREEFIKRDLPNEVVNYLQAENGEFKFPIDAFKQRATIETIAHSIANKKLIQQRMTGEALIQVASTGFELSNQFSEVREDNDLPFYDEPGKAQKVKIAFTKRWNPLLNLEYKGKKIGKLEVLNEAIKDEEWLKQNRRVISIVGVRIPVQGLNSQEFMEVFHFLPESMGGVIIVSPALVAKSGGDFDVDKLTTFFPNFNKQGKLNTLASKEEISNLKNKVKDLTNKFKKAIDKLDEADKIQENLADEIETYLFNLFSEDEDIVVEAKNNLEKIENKISKLEGISNKLDEEIKDLQSEIDQKSSAKKAYENELIDLIRDTLSRQDNFLQLIRPNDTDLLNNDDYGAGKLKELFKKLYQDNTFTSVIDFASILQEFVSNLVGKANLGIAAVNNVFFALAQRAGLHHNKNYTYRNLSGKLVTKPVEFYLPHNTIEVDGEDLVSLSGLTSKNANNNISDIISQYINGFVDVAKDDWVFFIGAVKELAPTMLYTAMAGTNAKTTIAFFNQPIMRDYIKNIDKYKNIFTKFKDPQSFTNGNWKALEDAVYKYVQQDENLKNIFEEESAKDGLPYIKIRKYVNENVSPNFLTEERLSEALHGDKLLSPEEQIFLIFHFWELKRQSGIVTNLQRSLNSDTKKVGTGYSSKERQLLFEDVEKSGLFNTDAMYRMRNESTVRAFTNDKTGFDVFVQQLYTDLFEVTNNPTFNNIIRELIKNDKELNFEFKSSKIEKLVNTIKNDFITYLYQNQVLDGNDNLFQKTQALFNPKSSIALELKNIKEKYPNSQEQFPILSALVTDNLKIGNKIIKTNLKLRQRLSDKDELNDAVRQIRELLSFNSNSYTPQEQIEIQQFTDRLIKFAIVQSGLNPSVYNLLDIVPNEAYTQNIKSIIKDVQKALNRDKNTQFSVKTDKKSPSQKSLEKFYNRFKLENPNFYKFEANEEGESPPINLINSRGKNYYLPTTDITGAKAKAVEDKLLAYIPTLPSKSITVDKNNGQTLKQNPKSLFIIYDNEKEDNKKALSLMKIVNFATITATSIEAMNRQIDEIISKSMNYDTISFNTIKGYFQDIKESNPELFNYGSQRLKDTFGIINTGFEEIQEQEVIEQPIQNTPETGKPGVFTVWHGSETNIKEFKSEFPEGFFHQSPGGSPKAIFFSKDKAPSDSVYGKRPYQKQFQITMNNPLVVNYSDPKGNEGGKNREQWIQEAIDKGHDGVIWRNIHDNFVTDVYVSLDSKKIKAVEQPINKEIKLNEIYNQLGNKTTSGNVQIKSVYQQEGVQYAKSIGGVFSLRVNNSNKHFGNPFSSVPSEIAKGLTATKSTKESVEKYIDWVINSQDERAIWIREQLKSGNLKNKPIVYYKELGEPSHATALDYLINRHNWNQQPINKEIKPVTFKTGKGSVYTYLPDGRVERFKTVEGKKYPAQDLIVFVKFKDSEQEQNFLEGVQDRERSGTKVYVIDKQGNKYSKNSDIKGKEVFLALVETKTNKVIDTVATKQEPTIGYNTYDESRYVENGEPMRSMHIGNKVTEISNQPTEIKPKIDSSKKIEDKIPKTGDIIEYNGIHYKVEETANGYYNIPDDFDDSLEAYVKTQLEENMPYYNLNPTNWRDVTVGNIDPLFNVPLIALVREGFTFVTQEQPIVEETKEDDKIIVKPENKPEIDITDENNC